MKTHFLPLFFLAAVFMGCEKEKPWPAPPEVPEELVFEVFPEEENVIKDGDFSQADLSTDIVATTRFYSAWGYSNSIPDNTTIAIKDLGGDTVTS